MDNLSWMNRGKQKNISTDAILLPFKSAKMVVHKNEINKHLVNAYLPRTHISVKMQFLD